MTLIGIGGWSNAEFNPTIIFAAPQPETVHRRLGPSTHDCLDRMRDESDRPLKRTRPKALRGKINRFQAGTRTMKTTTTTITAALAFIAASSRARGDLVPAGTGSGFFITPDGYSVTSFHVIEGGEAVKVKRRDTFLDARVIKSDARNAIAVLKLEGTFPCLPQGEDLFG